MTEKSIVLEDIHPIHFFGLNNENLKLLRTQYPKLKIVTRGNTIKIQGEEEDVKHFSEKLENISDTIKRHPNISEREIKSILSEHDAGPVKDEGLLKDMVLVHGPNGRIVKARTANQKKLVKYVDKNDIVFAIGPAGTGKTYTAVALAVRALKNKEVKRIILARPAVEAGENLGFLPGDLKEKIDPYLRPLYDALYDMIPGEKLKSYLESKVVEVAPMAFMRGRTLDNCFVILDEAQNATDMQLKMFLTRMGPHAKVIITGDMTQIDLPAKQPSGLIKAVKILTDIKGIKMAYLTVEDVVRHKLVKEIIKAYDTKL